MKEDKFCNKNHRPTLCWSCRRACGGCSWTARDPKTHEVRFEPVEGWEAEKTVVRGTSSRRQGHKLEGYARPQQTMEIKTAGSAKKTRWTADMWEDYNSASETERAEMLALWGEPR